MRTDTKILIKSVINEHRRALKNMIWLMGNKLASLEKNSTEWQTTFELLEGAKGLYIQLTEHLKRFDEEHKNDDFIQNELIPFLLSLFDLICRDRKKYYTEFFTQKHTPDKPEPFNKKALSYIQEQQAKHKKQLEEPNPEPKKKKKKDNPLSPYKKPKPPGF